MTRTYPLPLWGAAIVLLIILGLLELALQMTRRGRRATMETASWRAAVADVWREVHGDERVVLTPASLRMLAEDMLVAKRRLEAGMPMRPVLLEVAPGDVEGMLEQFHGAPFRTGGVVGDPVTYDAQSGAEWLDFAIMGIINAEWDRLMRVPSGDVLSQPAGSIECVQRILERFIECDEARAELWQELVTIDGAIELPIDAGRVETIKTIAEERDLYWRMAEAADAAARAAGFSRVPEYADRPMEVDGVIASLARTAAQLDTNLGRCQLAEEQLALAGHAPMDPDKGFDIAESIRGLLDAREEVEARCAETRQVAGVNERRLLTAVGLLAEWSRWGERAVRNLRRGGASPKLTSDHRRLETLTGAATDTGAADVEPEPVGSIS